MYALLLAQDDRWGGHMGWDGSWWMAVWGTLMMGGFVLVAIWLIRSSVDTRGGSATRTDEDPFTPAKRILAERYARGELSTDEYRERLGQLG